VKVPRFRIAWVMIFIALAALNFAAVRAALDGFGLIGELLALGFIPMASILAIGLLIGFLRRGSRPYLLGFELFGAIASVLYVLLVIFYGNETLRPYASLFIDPLEEIIGRERPLIFVPIACTVGALVLTLPQVAFALVGGFLSRKNRITTPTGQTQLPTDW